VTSNFFQSIGKPKRSIFLSLSRQLIFLTPLLYILPMFMGEKGVWWSFAISDLISTFVASALLYQFFKTFNHEKTA
jgi:Na+-driven multidrug efflux pump